MTHIETDNPLLQFWIWCYDITWQYWYIWLIVIVVYVLLVSRYFAKRKREFDAFMESERKRHEDFKRDLQKYRSQKERDLYENDVIEVNLKDFNPINKEL